MDYVVRTFQCDSGGTAEPHRFEKLLKKGGRPRKCPICRMPVDPRSVPIPSRVAIGGSPVARATDGTYRLLETSSAARAAELNAPSLKITDMKDNLREGDVAAKTPDNVVTRFNREAKDGLGINYMQWQGGGGMGVGRPMPAGAPGQSFAGPGHIALAAVQPEHAQRVQEIVANPTHKPYRGGR